MTELNLYKTRQLSAVQYVLALHQPEDRVDVLVRNRVREQTLQRRGWRERFEKFLTQLTDVPTAEGPIPRHPQSELVQIQATNGGGN
jgi:hypothetical protein